MAPLNHPLRVGLIGCGKMGLQHLKAIKAIGNVIVAGVADPLATRESLGELVPADALVVTDPSELLRKGQLDVAHARSARLTDRWVRLSGRRQAALFIPT